MGIADIDSTNILDFCNDIAAALDGSDAAETISAALTSIIAAAGG